MPLVIGIAVRDGLVVASDSRVYGSVNEGPARLISDHVPRLFRLSRYAAVAYWGPPLIFHNDEMVSVSSVVANIIADCAEESRLEEAATAFRRSLLASVGQEIFKTTGPFGFMFAGYDQNNVGRIMTVDLPGEDYREFRSTANPGITPQGYHRVVTRILSGLDPDLIAEFNSRPDEDAFKRKAANMRFLIPWSLLSIGDAAAIAETLIQTTAAVQRIAFAVGTPENHYQPDVGGPIDIAVVTRSGFHWVKRKSEYPATPSWPGA